MILLKSVSVKNGSSNYGSQPKIPRNTGSSRGGRVVNPNIKGSTSVSNKSIYIKPFIDSNKDCIRFVPSSNSSSSSTSISRGLQSNIIGSVKSNTVRTSVNDFIMDNNPLFGSSANSSYSTPKSMTPLFPISYNELGVYNGLNGINVSNEGSHFSYISRGTRLSFITNTVASTNLNSQSNVDVIQGVSGRVLEKRAIYNNTNNVVSNRTTLNTQDIHSNIVTVNNNDFYTEFVDIDGRKKQIMENVLENTKQYNYKNHVGIDVSPKETVLNKSKQYHRGNEDYDWYADKRLVKTKDGRRVFVSKDGRLLHPSSRDFKAIFKGLGGKK